MTGTLTDSELSARIPMSASSFYRRKRRGDFEFLQLVPQLPGPTRYSAEKVDRWLRGELVDAPVVTLPRRPGRPRRSHTDTVSEATADRACTSRAFTGGAR